VQADKNKEACSLLRSGEPDQALTLTPAIPILAQKKARAEAMAKKEVLHAKELL